MFRFFLQIQHNLQIFFTIYQLTWKFFNFKLLNSTKFCRSRHFVDLDKLILNIYILLGFDEVFHIIKFLNYTYTKKIGRLCRIWRLSITHICFYLYMYYILELDVYMHWIDLNKNDNFFNNLMCNLLIVVFFTNQSLF